MTMIRAEQPDFGIRNESQEGEKMGFIELISQQDAIRGRIEEIQLQIKSLRLAQKAGDNIDEQRLSALEKQLLSEDEQLGANEIALGRLQTPNIPQ